MSSVESRPTNRRAVFYALGYITMMIKLCPHCGRILSMKLENGISSCDNCCRIFDSSSYHRTLSAAWVVRLWHVYDPYVLKLKFGFSDCEVDLVEQYVIDQGLCHDEFLKVLDSRVYFDQSA